jgi:hypothetical protein
MSQERPMSQQPREPYLTADDPPDAVTQARGNTILMIEYLCSQLPPHPPGEPVTPLPLSKWPEYLKRRDEIKGAARRKGWLWCGIPQD